MGDKHAFLIIAHADMETLVVLLRSLDNIRNDIYLHIDKKREISINHILHHIYIYPGYSLSGKCE